MRQRDDLVTLGRSRTGEPFQGLRARAGYPAERPRAPPAGLGVLLATLIACSPAAAQDSGARASPASAAPAATVLDASPSASSGPANPSTSDLPGGPNPANAGGTTPGASPAGPESSIPSESTLPAPKYAWLDDTQELLYETLWRASEHVDRWFGSEEPDVAYEQGAYGSIAPAILWDQYDHTQSLLRFQANIPLPQVNEKFSAFVGRLNPEEYVAESQPYSGAFPNPYALSPQDQTIFGIQYQQPKVQGASWDYGAGMPVSLKRFDPYIKGGYNFIEGEVQQGLLYFRQDLFYQDSQGGFGVTSTLYLQKLFGQRLLLAWTGSTTFAQRSYGWRSYSTADAIYAFPNERALDFELEVDGATQAAVPLHDYGGKIAYRRSILRDWLVLEVRTGLDWPKDYTYQHRQMSFGLGLGFEMYFGTYEFQARSVTF